MSKTSSSSRSVSNASPSISSTHSSRPASVDVLPPRLDLARILLEREDAPAEVPDSGAEPDRRVAARPADLEHLARGLRRDEREEEPAGRGRDGPRALHARSPRSRSSSSSRSRRASTSRTRSSSTSRACGSASTAISRRDAGLLLDDRVAARSVDHTARRPGSRARGRPRSASGAPGPPRTPASVIVIGCVQVGSPHSQRNSTSPS